METEAEKHGERKGGIGYAMQQRSMGANQLHDFIILCSLDQDPTLCSHKISAPSGHSHIEFACGPLGH